MKKNFQSNQKDNNVTTIFGNGSAHSNDGPVSIATINQPQGIAIHPITQEVYIGEFYGAVNSYRGNVRAWNRTSQTVRTVISSTPSPGYLDFMNDGTLYFTSSVYGYGLYKMFTNGLPFLNFIYNSI